MIADEKRCWDLCSGHLILQLWLVTMTVTAARGLVREEEPCYSCSPYLTGQITMRT